MKSNQTKSAKKLQVKKKRKKWRTQWSKLQQNGGKASSTKSRLDEKIMMTVVLDLNGLLLHRCTQELTTSPCLQYSANRFFALRPGCIKFLEALLERFNVVVWSIAKEKNILSMLRSLFTKVGKK